MIIRCNSFKKIVPKDKVTRIVACVFVMVKIMIRCINAKRIISGEIYGKIIPTMSVMSLKPSKTREYHKGNKMNLISKHCVCKHDSVNISEQEFNWMNVNALKSENVVMLVMLFVDLLVYQWMVEYFMGKVKKEIFK